MTEIVCQRCNAQSPESALYCQQCGQPLRCQICRSELLPNARACIHCGKLIPERSSNEPFHLGMAVVPPGYNRLKLHETPEVRDVDLTVSDTAIQHIGDILPSLVGTRPKGHSVNPVDHQPQQQPDVVEIASEIPTHQPQLLAASSQPTASQEGIWEIFRDHEGRITQERRDLKATGKRDYIVRLAHLYLYAKYQHGDEKVPRDDVFKILDEAGVKDNHRSAYIYGSGIRSDENETLRLTLDGRDRAQRYLAEALDQNSPEGWRLGAESRSGGNLTKKQAKKGSEPRSDTAIAGWVSHEVTTELVKTTPHSTIDTMPLQNRALFALYCLEKAGVTTEVQSSQIARYLFAAFQIQIKAKSIPQALAKAVDNKPAYATYRKDSGYRITSSGIEHIESLLKSKQTEHTSATTAEANGAVPV